MHLMVSSAKVADILSRGDELSKIYDCCTNNIQLQIESEIRLKMIAWWWGDEIK